MFNARSLLDGLVDRIGSEASQLAERGRAALDRSGVTSKPSQPDEPSLQHTPGQGDSIGAQISQTLGNLLPGGMVDGAKGLAGKAGDTWNNQSTLGKTAIAGGLLGVLMTSGGRKLLGAGAKVGVTALIGGMAWKAWNDWKGGKEPGADAAPAALPAQSAPEARGFDARQPGHATRLNASNPTRLQDVEPPPPPAPLVAGPSAHDVPPPPPEPDRTAEQAVLVAGGHSNGPGGLPPIDQLEGSAFLPADPARADDLSARLFKAMIAAARADGHITDDERARIDHALPQLGLGADAEATIRAELDAPLDVARVAALARSPEEAVEIYTATLLVVDEQTADERAWLDALAKALKLDPGLVAHVEATARQLA